MRLRSLWPVRRHGLLGLGSHLFWIQTNPQDHRLFVRIVRAIVQHYNATPWRSPDSRIAWCGHQSTAYLPSTPPRRQCNDPAIRALLWIASWWHRHNSSVPSLPRIPPPRNRYQSTIRALLWVASWWHRHKPPIRSVGSRPTMWKNDGSAVRPHFYIKVLDYSAGLQFGFRLVAKGGFKWGVRWASIIGAA
jgi:hypothetical protein